MTLNEHVVGGLIVKSKGRYQTWSKTNSLQSSTQQTLYH
jgi:hypothetical protein